MDTESTRLHIVISDKLDRFLEAQAEHEESNKSVVARRYLLEAMRREQPDSDRAA